LGELGDFCYSLVRQVSYLPDRIQRNVKTKTLQKADIERSRELFRARLERQLNEREACREQALKAAEAIAPAVIANYPDVTAAYLFGSVLQPGSFHAKSDIDIAVEGIAPQAYSSLWRDLEAALPHWFIDLRELPAGASFTEIVKLTGKKIYEREDTTPASGNPG
jgi:predicted nucleotidyltransferase